LRSPRNNPVRLTDPAQADHPFGQRRNCGHEDAPDDGPPRGSGGRRRLAGARRQAPAPLAARGAQEAARAGPRQTRPAPARRRGRHRQGAAPRCGRWRPQARAAVKATDDDQFHLGSDTKPITAWLIAWLIEHGLLDWDTPLGKVFPELARGWPPTHRRITVTQLLTHHSGLPANHPGGWWSIPVKGTARAQRLDLMGKFGKIELESKPGQKFRYSNLGYTVLGAVAERVGKASWEDLLVKHVFGPLGMMGVGHGPMGKEGQIVQPWQHSPRGKPIEPKWDNDNPPVMGPAGRLHCSLPAWSRFVADVLRGARGGKGLLRPGTYAKMFETPFEDELFCRGGWAGRGRNAAGKGLVLAHDGSNTNNYCTAVLLADDNLAVLVATNQGGDAAREACAEVRQALVKRWLGR
jgi:CubicO group peptidase (beta-lactamase class C family)